MPEPLPEAWPFTPPQQRSGQLPTRVWTAAPQHSLRPIKTQSRVLQETVTTGGALTLNSFHPRAHIQLSSCRPAHWNNHPLVAGGKGG